MSVKLLPPGKRRNKTYYIIGNLEGEKIEVSTGTSIYGDALIEIEKFKDLKKQQKKFGKLVTFGYAAEAYINSRPNLSVMDKKRVGLICLHIGPMQVMKVVQDDIYRIASLVYGSKAKASTKNRYIITPASSVLNYAVTNEWRNPIRIKRFKEDTPKPRYSSDQDEKKLIKAVKHDEDKLLFVYWLFDQGDRISDSINPTYEDCDLKKKGKETYSRHIGKSDRYDIVPLSPRICKILRKRSKKGATGKIFKWKTRWGPSKWLRNEGRKLGVKITPHMARHSLGKRLNDSGAGLKTIMLILGQTDPRSAIRYQTTGIEELRFAKLKAVGKTVGRDSRKSKKAL